jgi:hypothetical protein
LGYDESINARVIAAVNSGVSWNNLVFNAGGGNVGIGTSSPGSLLSVNGSGYFAGNINVDAAHAFQQAGQNILYASSTITGTFAGIGAGQDLVTYAFPLTTSLVTNITAFGYQAMQFATSSDSTAIGYQSQQGTHGGNYNTNAANTTLGALTLIAASGFGNTAIGELSQENHTESQNTSVGQNSLSASGSGNKNVRSG